MERPTKTITTTEDVDEIYRLVLYPRQTVNDDDSIDQKKLNYIVN